MPEQVDLISSNYTFNVIPLPCQNTLMTESVTMIQLAKVLFFG